MLVRVTVYVGCLSRVINDDEMMIINNKRPKQSDKKAASQAHTCTVYTNRGKRNIFTQKRKQTHKLLVLLSSMWHSWFGIRLASKVAGSTPGWGTAV